MSTQTRNGMQVIPAKKNCQGPLHRSLGIETKVHRQAVMFEPQFRQWDRTNRVWSDNHLYRASITLPRI